MRTIVIVMLALVAGLASAEYRVYTNEEIGWIIEEDPMGQKGVSTGAFIDQDAGKAILVWIWCSISSNPYNGSPGLMAMVMEDRFDTSGLTEWRPMDVLSSRIRFGDEKAVRAVYVVDGNRMALVGIGDVGPDDDAEWHVGNSHRWIISRAHQAPKMLIQFRLKDADNYYLEIDLDGFSEAWSTC